MRRRDSERRIAVRRNRRHIREKGRDETVRERIGSQVFLFTSPAMAQYPLEHLLKDPK